MNAPNPLDWRRSFDWRSCTWKTAAIVVLLALFFIMNPELRAVLLFVDEFGLELMILLLAVQLRVVLPVAAAIKTHVARALCAPAFAVLRGLTRALALLLPPGRAVTFGLSTYLYVLSHNLWCPLGKSAEGL